MSTLSHKLRVQLQPLLEQIQPHPEHEEEICATLSVIDYLLRQNGHNWHDFVVHAVADKVEAKPLEPSWDSEMDPSELSEIIETIRESSIVLSDSSDDFLESLEDLTDKYDVVYLSDKQLKWLRDLYLGARPILS